VLRASQELIDQYLSEDRPVFVLGLGREAAEASYGNAMYNKVKVRGVLRRSFLYATPGHKAACHVDNGKKKEYRGNLRISCLTVHDLTGGGPFPYARSAAGARVGADAGVRGGRVPELHGCRPRALHRQDRRDQDHEGKGLSVAI
jgi:hypothetical protein